MPRFTFDEKSQNEKLKKAKEKGIRHILATNIAHNRPNGTPIIIAPAVT